MPAPFVIGNSSSPATVPFDKFQFLGEVAVRDLAMPPIVAGMSFNIQASYGLYNAAGVLQLQWDIDATTTIVQDPAFRTDPVINSSVYTPALPIVDPGDLDPPLDPVFSPYYLHAPSQFGPSNLNFVLAYVSDVLEIAGEVGWYVDEISAPVLTTSEDWVIYYKNIVGRGWAIVATPTTVLVIDPTTQTLHYFYIEDNAARVTRSFNHTSWEIEAGVNDWEIYDTAVDWLYGFRIDSLLCCLLSFDAADALYVAISKDEGVTWEGAVIVTTNAIGIAAAYDETDSSLKIVATDSGGVPKRVVLHHNGAGDFENDTVVTITGLPDDIEAGALVLHDAEQLLAARVGSTVTLYRSLDDLFSFAAV